MSARLVLACGLVQQPLHIAGIQICLDSVEVVQTVVGLGVLMLLPSCD
jgi:hypothetical protein